MTSTIGACLPGFPIALIIEGMHEGPVYDAASLCSSSSIPPFPPGLAPGAITDRVLAHANSTPNYSEGLSVCPKARLAIVTCMDSRIEVNITFGIEPGEAHILRNAGGLITTDILRSLSLSQNQLGTREIILIHHTNCGLHLVDESDFKRDLVAKFGRKPLFSLGSFDDPYEDVYLSAQEIYNCPFIPYTDHMRGFVYCVETGRLEEVDLQTPPAHHPNPA